MTIQDLLAFAKKQARLCTLDYDRQGYIDDKNRIRRVKYAMRKAAGMYASPMFSNTILLKGEYYGGRLIISDTKIEYIPGQYAPTEIYWAVADYFESRKNV